MPPAAMIPSARDRCISISMRRFSACEHSQAEDLRLNNGCAFAVAQYLSLHGFDGRRMPLAFRIGAPHLAFGAQYWHPIVTLINEIDFSLEQAGAYQGMSLQVTVKAYLGCEADEGALT
jgi:hypothetical protein